MASATFSAFKSPSCDLFLVCMVDNDRFLCLSSDKLSLTLTTVSSKSKYRVSVSCPKIGKETGNDNEIDMMIKYRSKDVVCVSFG